MAIRYGYELVALEPRALRGRKHVGEKSFREAKEKLARLDLTVGMPLEDDTSRAAVLATVAASLHATRG